MTTDEDKRKYRRIPTELVARFRKNASAKAVTTNVSFGGVFIETDLTFARGDVVAFDIFSEGKARISVVGVVRWLQEEPQGIGVELRDITAADREQWTEYVQNRAKRKSKR